MKRAIVVNYTPLPDLDYTRCAYCGEPSEAHDHVLPVNVARKCVGAGRVITDEERLLLRTVPVCRSCNSILGGRYHPTLWDRVGYLRRRLLHKDPSAARLPLDEYELEQLGPTLLGKVAWLQMLADTTRRRISYDTPLLDPNGPAKGMLVAPGALLEPGVFTMVTVDTVGHIRGLLEDLEITAEVSVDDAMRALTSGGYGIRRSLVVEAQRRRRGLPKKSQKMVRDGEPEWAIALREELRG